MRTRTLVLMRHAKSGYPDGVRDHDRPLSDRGRAEAALAGDWLRTHFEPVDEILCSTALRARQTVLATGLSAPIRLAAGIYDAGSADIVRELVVTADEIGTLLVVGHSPGVPTLAAELLEAGGDQHAADVVRQRFPTAAIAALEWQGSWQEPAAAPARLLAFHLRA